MELDGTVSGDSARPVTLQGVQQRPPDGLPQSDESVAEITSGACRSTALATRAERTIGGGHEAHIRFFVGASAAAAVLAASLALSHFGDQYDANADPIRAVPARQASRPPARPIFVYARTATPSPRSGMSAPSTMAARGFFSSTAAASSSRKSDKASTL